MSFVLKSSTIRGKNVEGDIFSCKSLQTTNISTSNVTSPSMVLTESASQLSPGAGKGRLWVRDDSPSVLVFTDDTGVDVDLGAGGGGYSDATTIVLGLGATSSDQGNIVIGGVPSGILANLPESATSATGGGSIAIGSSSNYNQDNNGYLGTAAAGTGAIAIGGSMYIGARALNNHAISIGSGSKAHGMYSISIGYYSGSNVVLGFDGAISIGSNSRAFGVGSVAIGDGSETYGLVSTAVGANTQAETNAIAIGDSATALNQSVAIGNSTNSITNSVAIGHQAVCPLGNSIAIGAYASTVGGSNMLAINLSGGAQGSEGSFATQLARGGIGNVQPVGTNEFLSITIGGLPRKIRLFT